MRGIVLVCGINLPHLPGIDPDRIITVSQRPGKSDVDAVLAKAAANDTSGSAYAHVTVAGTDADLAAVTLRLLRRDRLGSTVLGYLPMTKNSAFAALWGLPTDPAAAFALANRGAVRPVPLLRDDVGGVLVARGVLTQVNGMAYCDDELALRGNARRIEVQPDNSGGAGLVVRVQRGRLRRTLQTSRARAFSLACDPTAPVLDGVRRDRLIERWTWYRHTEDLRIIRPNSADW